jgi:threonine dehydratase
MMMHIIRRGLAVDCRFLALRVTVPDRPGELARLLARIGASGVNVVDVAHTRIAGRLPVGDAVVALNLETRGPEHCATLITDLDAAGYQVVR